MRNILMITTLLACSICMYADEWMSVLDNKCDNGYVQYGTNPVANIEDVPVFYRTCIDGETTIDGKVYKGVAVYNGVVKYYPQNLAYMREENGKVYAVYNAEYCDPNSYYEPGKEYLLYDFNMKVGESIKLEPRVTGEESIVLKCVEAGLTKTEYGTRRFLKFDRNVNATTRRWMAYEYIVEGIGPVGNCNFAVPYRITEINESNGLSQAKTIDMLYQRASVNREEDIRNEIVWTLPAFEVWGVHDPAVWCFLTDERGDAAVKNISSPIMPDENIKMESCIGGKIITSCNGDIKEVVVFDVLGKELAHYFPNSNNFKICRTIFDTKIIIVRVSTGNSSRSFKCLFE